MFSVPPSIGNHDYSDRLILPAGGSVALEIPFKGCPQPSVSWRYKGGRLPDARRFKEDTIHGMTSLTMAKALRTDSGKYTLTLENQHGKTVFNIEIVVLDKPSAPENLKVKTVTEDSVSISWDEPKDDGGALITEYVIEKREKGMSLTKFSN